MSDDPTEQFSKWLNEIQTRLHGYIFSLTRDLSDTDDLYQQTALILWKKFDQFDPDQSSFLSWACGVARFEVMNFLRVRSRKKLYFSDQLNLQLIQCFDKEPNTEVELRKEALEKCKSSLRDRDRALVDECYGQSDGVRRVAEKLDRSSQSVHNSLKRIRTALFECIKKQLLQLSHGSERDTSSVRISGNSQT